MRRPGGWLLPVAMLLLLLMWLDDRKQEPPIPDLAPTRSSLTATPAVPAARQPASSEGPGRPVAAPEPQQAFDRAPMLSLRRVRLASPGAEGRAQAGPSATLPTPTADFFRAKLAPRPLGARAAAYVANPALAGAAYDPRLAATARPPDEAPPSFAEEPAPAGVGVLAAGAAGAGYPAELPPQLLIKEERKIQDVWLDYLAKHEVVKQYERDWFAHSDLTQLTLEYQRDHAPLLFMKGLVLSPNFGPLALKYARSPQMRGLLRDAIGVASSEAIKRSAAILSKESAVGRFVTSFDQMVRSSDASAYSPVEQALAQANRGAFKHKLGPLRVPDELRPRPVQEP